MSLYHLNVLIHILAALFWLGGMFFLAVVGAPVLRRVEPPELRADLFRRIGERFRSTGWIAIAILIVTGLLNVHFRGMQLHHGDFWGTRLGQALALKLGAVLAMLIVQAVHDFVVGPAASRARPGTPEQQVARRRAALLARSSAVLGLVVVYAAVRLARGG